MESLHSKICVGLFCLALLLNINTIEAMSGQSSISTSTTPPPSTGDCFSSIVRMKELAGMEQSVIAEISAVLENFETTVESSLSETLWEEGLSKMKSYIHDYDSSVRPMISDTADAQTAVISHPLMSYRMLRRVVFNLPEILHYNVDGRLEKLANIAELIQPAATEDDVVGAMQGILRLQKTYLVSAHDFAQGRLLTVDTKSGLTEMDCFRIGNLALNENKQSAIAIEWLLQALRVCLRIEVEGSSELSVIEMVRRSLRNAIEVHNNYVKDKKPWTFGKPIKTSFSEMTRDNEEELIKAFPSPPLPLYQLYITERTKFDEINFFGLCRGDKLRNETLTRNLKCYYKSDNPFLAIKPLKVEVHSEDPLIMQFYDVLPDVIIKQFTNTASHRLKRATLGRDRKVSEHRTACNAFIDDKKDEILSRVPKIIHESTGFNLMPADSSELSQVSTYGGIGGYYGHHYDTLYTNPDSKYPNLDVASKTAGERIATIMFYLSDLRLGGGTAFPKIGVYAEPIKGSAIFWYNLKKNGQRHEYTMHGGCPVLLGEKWVVNKWIKSGDQMFVRKCSLDSNM